MKDTKIISITIIAITTLFVLIMIDFFTLFLVLVLVGYYRYLKQQNEKGQLVGFNLQFFEYFNLIRKYALIATDWIIGLFFK